MASTPQKCRLHWTMGSTDPQRSLRCWRRCRTRVANRAPPCRVWALMFSDRRRTIRVGSTHLPQPAQLGGNSPPGPASSRSNALGEYHSPGGQMGTRRKETRAQIALKCPRVVNVEDLGPELHGIKGPVLVHFNSRQLRRALRPLRRVRTLRGVRSWLELLPIPGTPDPGAVLVNLRCRSRCIALPGFTGGGFGWFCECHLERADDPRAGPPKIPTEPCVLTMVGTRIVCRRGTCGGNCVPVWTVGPTRGSFRIACVCH